MTLDPTVTTRWIRERERIDEAARRIADASRHEDEPERGLAVLRETGLLALPAAEGLGAFHHAMPWPLVFHALARIGGADLSLARLYEGHLNAVQLVALYGSTEQKRLVTRATGEGTLLGVWGADTEPRFAVEERDGRLHLRGAKRYASGLGLVGLALVPYEDESRVSHLLLLPVGERARQDEADWDMRGMQGSRSGTFLFEGMAMDAAEARVGQGGDYRREPFFVGGIWRCAAAQLGALERLVQIMADELAASGRLEHPMQSARMGEAIMAARDARLNVRAAAQAVRKSENPEFDGDEDGDDRMDPDLAVSLAALARLRVESAALTVIQIAERGLGLAAFHRGHPAERVMRDLSVYLRQANPDALLLGQARRLSARLPDLFR